VNFSFRTEGAVSQPERGAATHLYHIAQEAVRNAIRHGRARHVGIVLREADGVMDLSVRDDGCGLPDVAARGQGLGLSIMAHRAEIIGWQLAVSAPAGGGTLVTCRSSVRSPRHA